MIAESIADDDRRIWNSGKREVCHQGQLERQKRVIQLSGPEQKRTQNSLSSLVHLIVLISLLGVECGQSAGTVAAWGYYYDLTMPETYKPMYVPSGLSNVVAISGGYNNALALKADGNVVAWGWAGNGQNNVPPNATNILAVAAGAQFNLVLKDDGKVIGWGHNSGGAVNVPTNLTDVIEIAAGFAVAAALKADGTVVTWGGGTFGPPMAPSSVTGVVAIACGLLSALALKSDGTVVAGGVNSGGQTNIPAGLSNVVAISAAFNHCLVLESDGTVVAWGDYSPDSTSLPSSAPLGLSQVVSIASGYHHDLVLREDGSVVAWGAGTNVSMDPISVQRGQSLVPAGLSNVVAVAGGRTFSLALIGDGPPALGVNPTTFSKSGNSFSVSVMTQSGRVYRLEYKNSLNDMTWAALPLVAGDGKMKTLTDPTATSAQRFYRVRRW